MIAYDAYIPNLQRWTEIANGIPFGSSLVGIGLPIALCPQIQKRCTGANQQYSSSAGCIATLEAKKTGDFNEAWGDNMVCRLIHFQLTIVRPEVGVIMRTVLSKIAYLAPRFIARTLVQKAELRRRISSVWTPSTTTPTQMTWLSSEVKPLSNVENLRP